MVVGWDRLVLWGNVARTATDEAQRQHPGVEGHHHFMGRQKRALIRKRRNRDLGVGDRGNLSPGALENRKTWVSEREKGKGNVQPPVSELPASVGPRPGLAPRS